MTRRSKPDFPLETLARVTEFAAIRAAVTVGYGSPGYTDWNAVDAMRKILAELAMTGRIVSAEGKLDNAARFMRGEVVGGGGEEMAVAVDPIDGSSLCAKGQDGAISVIAVGPPGSILNAEELYMHGYAVGPKARGTVSFDNTPAQNIRNVMEALGKRPNELRVAILDRERNREIIAEARALGVTVKLLTAGDLFPAISTCLEQGSVDMCCGSGGGPEAAIAAAAISLLGGDFVGRLDVGLTEREIGHRLTLDEPVDESPLRIDQIANGVYAVSITAVTQADFLKGVHYSEGPDGLMRVHTHTLMIRNSSTVSVVENARILGEHAWREYIPSEEEERIIRARFVG